MKHHIMVKWNEQVADKKEISERVAELFSTFNTVEGVEQVEIINNCIDRPNRYDLLIRVTLPKEKLTVWDASKLHHDWKEQFSPMIASKAIFDCE